MREHEPGEGYGADILGADVVAFLRRREQGMQHLDRRLEHLDEFENALIGAVEAAGIAVGVGVMLRERFKLANIDLADERRDILIVFIARLGLGDGGLPQARRHELDHAELVQVAARLIKALQTPGRHEAGELAARYVEVALKLLAHRGGIEQAEGRFKNRADFGTEF